LTPVALSIAGFDPSSGAGITADLATFAAHRVFGTSAITVLTVQSTLGVVSATETDPSFLRQTLDYLVADLPPAGIKLGALGGEASSRVIADFLSNFAKTAIVPVVCDPVFSSSSGYSLFNAGPELYHQFILPRVSWVTPNWRELGILTGLPTTTNVEIAAAAAALAARHSHLGVIATGGDQAVASDFLRTSEGEYLWLTADRIESNSTHGTGCAFSSAFLANLILGRNSVGAAGIAKDFVAQAIRRAPGIGRGKGPMNLVWPLRRPDSSSEGEEPTPKSRP
jgi:hydroxymethylpyrimidine/phosphomethylpyrimidine kinase